MTDDYPYSELDVFVAGYQRGRSFAREQRSPYAWEELTAEELGSRRLTMFDVTSEGLMMLGMKATFIPREIFSAGVERGFRDMSP